MIEVDESRLMAYILSKLKTSTTSPEDGTTIPLWMMVYSKEYIEIMAYLQGKDKDEKENANQGEISQRM